MAPQQTSAVSLERLIRQVISEQTERARTLLANPLPPDATAIHETRKAVKRLRAALSLIRDELGPHFDEWNERLGAVNQQLSTVRDLDACLKIVHDLRPTCPDPQQAVLDELQAEMMKQRAVSADVTHNGTRQALVEELDAVLQGVSRWQNAAEGFDLVQPALRTMVRRARKIIRQLHNDPHVEKVHALRKVVKRRLYWLEFLQPIWPRGFHGEQKLVDTLADRLGDHHDLAVLLEWLRTSADARTAADQRAVRGLEQRLLSRQKKLERRALNSARYLFAEKPKAFARRWKGLWKVWRDRPQPVEPASTVDPSVSSRSGVS